MDFTDFTDCSDCPEKSEAASSRRTPAGPVAAHLEDTLSWSRAVMGGQSPPWAARAGGGPVFLPEIIYVRFSKRTHMTAPGKIGKHRFPEGIRVIRSPGAKKSKSFFCETKPNEKRRPAGAVTMQLTPAAPHPAPLPIGWGEGTIPSRYDHSIVNVVGRAKTSPSPHVSGEQRC